MRLVSFAAVCITLFFIIVQATSCANMVPPTGGPRDTLSPVLRSAVPRDSSSNFVRFSTKPIVLTFDEYVTLDNVNENLIVSPIPKSIPNISSKLKTVTIKIRDTLEENTTYSFNFGKAIKDVNEGNAINYTYVFSTGKTIDNNGLKGNVMLADNGKVDSTLIVVLHRSMDDSAIKKLDPRYYAKVDGKGNFKFKYLPAEKFKIYAIPGGFFKRYKDSTELFAFADSAVVPGDTASSKMINLFAYREAQDSAKAGGAPPKTDAKKKDKGPEKISDTTVKYTTNLTGTLDVLHDLVFTFKNPLKTIDTTQIMLTDTLYRPISGYRLKLDSIGKTLTVKYSWKPDTYFKMVLLKNAFTDSIRNTLAKNDTIPITTKREGEYGSIVLRFKNVDKSRNPLLQLIQSEKVVESIDVTQGNWTRKLYPPGTYQLRLLYDKNKNGIWDAGNFEKKRQPEVVIALSQDLVIRANWDNESEIKL